MPRCERPVSSVVCVHLNPPPLIEGGEGGEGDDAPTSAPGGGSSHSSATGGGDGAVSSNVDGDDWGSGWDSDDDKEEVRLQWAQDLCGGNATGNATSLWEHLDDVEESVLRYKVKKRGGGGLEKERGWFERERCNMPWWRKCCWRLLMRAISV